MDPLVFAALCGLGSGVVGFIGGAAAFNALWKIIFRQQHRKMTEVHIYIVPGCTHTCVQRKCTHRHTRAHTHTHTCTHRHTHTHTHFD